MGIRIAVQSLWANGDPNTFMYEFDQGRVSIGRARSADVQLPHPAVSGAHATIQTRDSGYVLIDEGSTNGTRVNETRVAPGRPKALRSEDRIDLGGYRLILEVGVPVAETTSTGVIAGHACQMLREQGHGPTVEGLRRMESAPDQRIELLPIREERKAAPRPSVAPNVARTPTRRTSTTELVVYSLAGLLLTASVVGMLLLRS